MESALEDLVLLLLVRPKSQRAMSISWIPQSKINPPEASENLTKKPITRYAGRSADEHDHKVVEGMNGRDLPEGSYWSAVVDLII